MLSHTIPRKLLEHFAYDDPVTKSKRLWRYQKGRPPSGKVAPKSATRWDGHFADPDDAAKEAVVELRLKREFEEPVNQFLDLIRYETFAFTATHIRLLTGYVTMLFHRSRARRDASDGQESKMIDALRGIRGDEDRLAQLVAKQTMDMVSGGLRRMLTKEELIAGHRQHDCRTPEGRSGATGVRAHDGNHDGIRRQRHAPWRLAHLAYPTREALRDR